jgi:Domain of unknown function (DUF5122) beta-propeller
VTRTRCGLFLCLIVAALAAAAPASAQTASAPSWSVNGSVSDVVRLAPHRLLVAGSFTRVGRSTGSAALVRRDTGGALAFPLFDGGPVRAFAADGAGGWFVGGDFRSVDGAPRSGLAHVLADGTVDPAFAPELRKVEGIRPYQGSVRALVVTDGRLFVGGVFDTVDGVARNSLAAFELADASLASWDPNANDGVGTRVNALAADGSTVFVGGWFSKIAGAERHGVAALDASTGVASPWDPDAANVDAIVLDAGTVYLAGLFETVGGQPRNYVAAVDEISGEPTPWNPGAVAPVHALALDAATVFAGMGNTGNDSRHAGLSIYAYSRTGTGSTTWFSRSTGDIEALVADAGVLYVAGSFDRLAGIPRSGLGAFDTATGRVSPWNPDPAVFATSDFPFTSLYALAATPEGVLAGGDFSFLRGAHRTGLAVVDPATGAVAPWNAWLNGPVSGLVRSHGRVYLVGPFTRIRSATRNGAAALGTGLRLLAWKPPKLSAGPADDVTVFDGKVVLTGQFNWVGRTHRHGSLAAFDPVRGKLLDWGPPRLLGTSMQLVGTRGRHVYAILDGEPFTVVLLNRRTGRLEHRLVRHNGDVYDAVLRGRTLYLGGAFNRVAGAGRNGLAAVDAVTGRLLAWRQDTDESVFSLTLAGGLVYAGGQFTQVGGQPRAGLAALDARTAAVQPWGLFPVGFSGSVVHTGAGLAVRGRAFSYAGSEWPYFAFLG